MTDTPYVGLVPYGEEDADFFFGRDQEIRIVMDNLRASRLTILYGGSGVGKTSLLQAGVIHSLRAQVREAAGARPDRASFAICTFRDWRDDPLPPLMNAIQDGACEAVGRRAGARWRRGTPVVRALRAWTRSVRTLLVVLDQFEDYFFYHPQEKAEATFATALPEMVNERNLRVNVLLSIREDSWAKLDCFEGNIPRLFENYVRVEHLNRAAAREAIERPVAVWNSRLPPGEERYVLDPALVPAVIDAVASGDLALTHAGVAVDPSAERAEGVEAPFLQLVMDRLWRASVEAGVHDLTLSRLEELGGPQRIVENHLLGALSTLTSAEQATAADLFRFLVTRSKTKIAHEASDLADWTGHPESEVAAVLEKLCRGESGRVLRRVSSPRAED